VRAMPRPSDLTNLLEQAAVLAPADVAWCTLTIEAAAVTERLAAVGDLPATLTVSTDDPSVVVARTLAAAWRHVSRTPERAAAASCA
jgi:hypothetical protein